MGSVILIKPSTDVLNSAFLTAQLKHPAMYHKLFNSSGSSAQQAIYLKDVKKLVCILPSLSLQNEFACLVEKIEALKDTMFTQSDEIETQFQALMQKAFKGEL
jgi:type I restriction enzyme S subunit